MFNEDSIYQIKGFNYESILSKMCGYMSLYSSEFREKAKKGIDRNLGAINTVAHGIFELPYPVSLGDAQGNLIRQNVYWYRFTVEDLILEEIFTA